MKTLTAKQAAEYLGYSPSYVTSHLLQTGIIPAVKDERGRWVIDEAAVRAYIKPEPGSTAPRVKHQAFTLPDAKPKLSELEANRARLREQMEAVSAGRIGVKRLNSAGNEL